MLLLARPLVPNPQKKKKKYMLLLLELHKNLDHHHPGDKQRRSQTKEEALS